MPQDMPNETEQYALLNQMMFAQLGPDESWVRQTAERIVASEEVYSYGTQIPMLERHVHYYSASDAHTIPVTAAYEMIRIRLGTFLRDHPWEAQMICEMMLRVSLANRREHEQGEAE